MKKQYTTKFYENSGGAIQAVTFDEAGSVINIIDGLEFNSAPGEQVLAAARENWPDADPYDPQNWCGKTMQQAAEELESLSNPPYGEERGVDLIAVAKPAPEYITDDQYSKMYVDFKWRDMGAAGRELFQDLDLPEAVAYRIKKSIEWTPDDCIRLCEMADMAEEYDAAGEDFENVVSKAADKLGVEIW